MSRGYWQVAAFLSYKNQGSPDSLGNRKSLKQENFEEVYEEHADYAYGLARHLSSSASEADDVFQETFLKVYRFLDKFQGGSMRAWVRKITVNSFYSLVRKKKQEVPLEQVAEAPSQAKDDPAENLAACGLSANIEQALASLPENHRTILILREFEDLNYEEIADLLEIAVGTVRSRLARARAGLKQALEELESSQQVQA